MLRQIESGSAAFHTQANNSWSESSSKCEDANGSGIWGWAEARKEIQTEGSATSWTDLDWLILLLSTITIDSNSIGQYGIYLSKLLDVRFASNSCTCMFLNFMNFVLDNSSFPRPWHLADFNLLRMPVGGAIVGPIHQISRMSSPFDASCWKYLCLERPVFVYRWPSLEPSERWLGHWPYPCFCHSASRASGWRTGEKNRRYTLLYLSLSSWW